MRAGLRLGGSEPLAALNGLALNGPHSSLAYRTPDEFANACSDLTDRMGFKAPISPQPPVLDQERRTVVAVKGPLDPP